MRRFLNADSYGSTGQGFTGFNMFAYCMNSPVTRIDEAGTDSIWWRLIEDYCFGFIHLAVQMHIVLHNPGIGMEKAVYNNEDKICGRADIFNLKTGEVWELKTVRTGAEAAALQVEKYCGNHLKDSDKKLTKGMSGRFLDYFYLQCGIDNYMVTYSTPQDGVILYHVKKCRLAQEEAYAEYVPIPQLRQLEWRKKLCTIRLTIKCQAPKAENPQHPLHCSTNLETGL